MMSSFRNNVFSLKPNDCCLRNTLSYCLIPSLLLKNNWLCFYSTHSYFCCCSIFDEHSTRLIFSTILNFFKFVRILLSFVRYISKIKFFSKIPRFIHISRPCSVASTPFFIHAFAVNRGNTSIYT